MRVKKRYQAQAMGGVRDDWWMVVETSVEDGEVVAICMEAKWARQIAKSLNNQWEAT
jgi:hypothetical protein